MKCNKNNTLNTKAGFTLRTKKTVSCKYYFVGLSVALGNTNNWRPVADLVGERIKRGMLIVISL